LSDKGGDDRNKGGGKSTHDEDGEDKIWNPKGSKVNAQLVWGKKLS